MPAPIRYRSSRPYTSLPRPEVIFGAIALLPDPDAPQPFLLADGQGLALDLEALSLHRVTLVIEAEALGPTPVLVLTLGLLQYRIRFFGYTRLAAAYRLHTPTATLRPLWGGGFAPELPCQPIEAEFIGGSWPAGAVPLTLAVEWNQVRPMGFELLVERQT